MSRESRQPGIMSEQSRKADAIAGGSREPYGGPDQPAVSNTPRPSVAAADTAGQSGGGDQIRTPEALRQLIALLANVTVLTALLVYFGWQRSETEARQLGIDESVFGMGTRDYVLRSVGPVLRLLAVIGVAGLAAVYADRALTRWARRRGPADRWVRVVLRLVSLGWIVLPMLVIAVGYLWWLGGFILFPLSIAAGVLLLPYRAHLDSVLGLREDVPPTRLLVQRVAVALLVGIGLFWTTSRYAEVVGGDLADSFAANVHDRASVVIYSEKRLMISAPGAKEERLPPTDSAYRYRYTGLRLWSHLGGNYLFLSDGWTRRYGVALLLPDDAPVRLEFVHDAR